MGVREVGVNCVCIINVYVFVHVSRGFGGGERGEGGVKGKGGRGGMQVESC